MFSKTELKELILNSTMGGSLTTGQMLMNMFVTAILVMIIYVVYRKTYDGVLYSKNFNVTLVMMGIVTSLAVMAISGNLALSLGMIGALSIVRYRSAIKDPKDIGYIFWVITIGIICGVSYYKLAIFSTLFLSGLLLLFSKKFTLASPYLLIIKYDNLDMTKLKATLKKNVIKFKVKNTIHTDSGNEIIIEIRFNKEKLNLVDKIKTLNGIRSISLISYDGSLETI